MTQLPWYRKLAFDLGWQLPFLPGKVRRWLYWRIAPAEIRGEPPWKRRDS